MAWAFSVKVIWLLVLLCFVGKSLAIDNTCFDHLSTDLTTCGGHGLCTGPDNCMCLDLTSTNSIRFTSATKFSQGTYLKSSSGRFYIYFQDDANIVLIKYGQVVWALGTNQLAGSIKFEYRLGSDGSMTIYNSNGGIVKSVAPACSSGVAPYTLVMQNDGYLVIYDSTGKKCWTPSYPNTQFTTTDLNYGVFTGSNCSTYTCFGQKSNSSVCNNGACTAPDTCTCDPGYFGNTCSNYTCFGQNSNSSVCNNGACTAPDTCTCKLGYYGPTCSSYNCYDVASTDLITCGGHGLCTGPNNCMCLDLTSTNSIRFTNETKFPQGTALTSSSGRYLMYFQDDANIVLLQGGPVAWALGSTQKAGTIKFEYRLGSDGSMTIYNSNGVPINSVAPACTSGVAPYTLVMQNDGYLVIYDSTGKKCWSPNYSKTIQPITSTDANSIAWTDSKCVSFTCFGKDISSSVCNNGTCTSPNTCTCNPGYFGNTCSNYTCFGKSSNSSVCNNGACTAPDTCTCKVGYYGPTCSSYNCSGILSTDLTTCGGHGLCTGPNTCMCLDITSTNSIRFTNETKFPQGTSLKSSSGRYIMYFQDDANIVLLQGGPVAWALGSSEIAGTIKFEYRLGSDGSMTIYNSNGVLINSVAPACSTGVAPYTLVMQNDGYLVIYDSTGKKCWSPNYSKTIQPITSTDSNNILWTDSKCVSFTCFGKDISSSVCNNGTCTSPNTCTCNTGYSGSNCLDHTCFGQNYKSSVCNNGTCTSIDTCTCKAGYYGSTCSNYNCFGQNSNSSVCNNGSCTSPDTCTCKIGYYGPTCSNYTCFGQKSNSSVCNNGTCVSADKCACLAGYNGSTCSNYTCFGQKSNSSVCNNGACTAPDTCTCKLGYYGPTCSSYNCSGVLSTDLTTCGGHGLCTGPDTCMCLDLTSTNSIRFTNETKFPQGTALTSSSGRYLMYFQDDANIVLLQGGPVAWALGSTQKAGTIKFEYRLGSDGSMTIYNSNGVLINSVAPACSTGVAPYTLVMQNDGYLVIYDSTGKKCWSPNYSKPIQIISSTDSNNILWTDSKCLSFSCFGKDISSSVCNNGTCTSPNTCTCNTGYSGSTCSNYTCYGQKSNSSVCNHGTCTAPDTCICKAGYYGPTCSNYNCFGQNSNSSVCNNGSCTSPDTCTCKAGYYGDNCSKYNCYGKDSTSSICNTGNCTSPDTCTCLAGYFGKTCSNYTCFGKSSNSSVCNNGTCTSLDICTCNTGSFGKYCNSTIYTCYGKDSASSVCNNGTCTSLDTCTCNTGMYGTFCNLTTMCFKTTFDNSTVCGGFGLCTGTDTCLCLDLSSKNSKRFSSSIVVIQGESLYSSSGRFTLKFQSDGQLATYDSQNNNSVVWTSGQPNNYLNLSQCVFEYRLNTDGSLQIFENNKYKQITNSISGKCSSSGPYSLVLQNDGLLVLYGATGYKCWSSGNEPVTGVTNANGLLNAGPTCYPVTCFGQSQMSSVCNNGFCTSLDTCTCSAGYYGKTCLNHTCFGKSSNSSVCNNGSCTALDTCTCKAGYYGTTCMNFTCFGKNQSSLPCNQGTCTALDVCTCNPGYIGKNCSTLNLFNCYGKPQNDTSVCGGHGLCVGNNNCSCLDISKLNSYRVVNKSTQLSNMTSSSGRFSMLFINGNMILRNVNKVIWSLNATFTSNASYELGVDGSLLISGKQVVGPCIGFPPFTAVMKNDGIFGIYDSSGFVCWSTPNQIESTSNYLSWNGSQCDFTICFNKPSTSLVCNHGLCTAPNTCTCNEGFWGTCDCKTGYFGAKCSNYTCFGQNSNSSVCNNGACTSPDTCTCKAGYYGPTCSNFNYNCYGVVSTDLKTCGGHGLCTGPNTCMCLDLTSTNSIRFTNETKFSQGTYLKSSSGRYLMYFQDDANIVLVKSGQVVWSFGTTQQSGSIKFEYRLGSDGSMTIYNSNGGIVKSVAPACSSGVAPYTLVMQNDGYLVIYDSIGRKCWTPTYPSNSIQQITSTDLNNQWFGNNCNSSLNLSCFGKLPNDTSVCGGHGLCTGPNTCMCLDLTSTNSIRFSSATKFSQGTSLKSSSGRYLMYFQDDANIVLLQAGQVAWAFGTTHQSGSIKFEYRLGSDGSMTIYNSNGVLINSVAPACSAGVAPYTLVLQNDGYLVIYDSTGRKCWTPTYSSNSIQQIISTDLNYNQWFGNNCNVSLSCFGKLPNDTSVCGGHGLCTSPDSCSCKAGYLGSACNVMLPVQCGGKLQSDTSVCSGHGLCTSYEACTCLDMTSTNSWNSGTIKDPSTLVSLSGRFILKLQDDGNMILYDGSNVLYWLGTTLKSSYTVIFVFDPDGSMYVKAYREIGWALMKTVSGPCSQMGGVSPYRAVVQDNGIFSIYSSNGITCWSTDNKPVSTGALTWSGSLCNVTYCYGQPSTSSVCNYGTCASDGTCTCNAGYFGDTCSKFNCFGQPSTSSVCNHGTCTAFDTCTCNTGYVGKTCSNYTCFGQPSTSSICNHGTCTSVDTCTCKDGYTGSKCSEYKCFGQDATSSVCNHGTCTAPDKCTCYEGYNGTRCELGSQNQCYGKLSNDPEVCNGHGICVGSNTCSCLDLTSSNSWNSGTSKPQQSSIISTSGRYSLMLRNDGSIALFDGPNYFWSSTPADSTFETSLTTYEFVFSIDGSISSFNNSGRRASVAIGACNSAGSPPFRAVMQNDGIFVIYGSNGYICWSSADTALIVSSNSLFWNGSQCSYTTCFGQPSTSSVCNYGTCTAPDTCTCNIGYFGKTCSNYTCFGQPKASSVCNNGACTSLDTCTCNTGYVGKTCSNYTCFGQPSKSSVCNNGICTALDTCTCNTGYTGKLCSIPTCFGQPATSSVCNHGTCAAPDTCICNEGYNGIVCSNYSCNGKLSKDVSTCGGHGLCTAIDNCMCLDLTSSNSIRFTNATKFSQGTSLKSSSGRYLMYFQDDANIVLLQAGKVVWAFGTTQKAGTIKFEYRLGSDGSMTIYNSNGVPINSVAPACSAGVAPYTLVMQNDGYLVIYDSTGRKCWTPTYPSKTISSTDLNYMQWYGSTCNSTVYTCYGKPGTSSVCNYGSCSAPDTCTCNPGYFGKTCSSFTCFGKLPNDTSVCGGHGLCTGYNTCMCLDLTSSNSIRFSSETKFSQGTSLTSSSGRYFMYFNHANLILTSDDDTVNIIGIDYADYSFTTNIYRLGSDGSMAIYMEDGSYVASVASACSAGVAPYTLVLQNDGHLVIYDSTGKNCWTPNYFDLPSPTVPNSVIWPDLNCSPYTCFGQTSNSSVCNHGTCTAHDTCTCNEGYFGKTCSNYTCFGQSVTSSVCNFGICTAPNTCQCNNYYSGTVCDIPTCYGIPANNVSVCSSKGSCVSVDKCSCITGHTTLDNDRPCSSCLTGYSMNSSGVCTMNCPPEYSGPNCDVFTMDPACTAIPSSSIPFCKSFITYRVRNTKYSVGATSDLSRNILFAANVLAADQNTNASFIQYLKKIQNLNQTCDTNCQNSIKKLLCYQTFTPCNQVSLKYVEDKKWCSEVCNIIVNNEIGYPSLFNNTCKSLPSSNCYYGSYLPPSTTCYDVSFAYSTVCSGRGTCIGQDSCSCKQGFSGNNCQFNVCFGKDSNTTSVCNGNGQCTAPNVCTCSSGYTAYDCSMPTCNGKSQAQGACSSNGLCTAPNICKCYGNYEGTNCASCAAGFTGLTCSIPICNNLPATDSDVCGGRGVCSSVAGVPACICNSGFSGASCQNFKCNNIDRFNSNVCSGRGNCIASGICQCSGNYDPTNYCSQCSRGYTGADCMSKATCSSEGYCSNHGSCDSTLTKCICNGNWIGDYCDKCKFGYVGDNCQIPCSSSGSCNSKGTCNNDGTCSCNGNAIGAKCESCSPGWYGPNCDFQIVTSSFGFSKEGDSITGTVFSNLKTVDDCSSIITNTSTLGKDPVCILNSATSQIQIILGSMATIGMGSILQFRVFLNSQITTSVAINKKDYQVVPPVALLIADKSQISKSCGSVYLDASGSVSLDRRQLKFSWKAIATPTESDSEYLNSILSTVTASGISISGGLLTVGVYSIQVTVLTSFTQAQTIDSISFQVSDISSPIVTINEGLSSTYIIGTSSLITPLVTFPTCYNGTGSIQYSYSQNIAESHTAVSIATNNEFLVFSKDYTYIREEGEYFFTLKVSQPGASSTITSFKVVAIASPLKISFSTTGVSQSFETPVSFSLAIFDPSFPSSSEGNVTLSCVNLDTASMCDGFSNQKSNIDRDTLKFNRKMSPGIYLFKAVFTKSARSVSETVKFVILDQPSSGLIILQIKDVGKTVDPSQDLVLQSILIDSVSSSRVFTWSSTDFTFDPLITTLTNPYLVIPKSLLAYGASYTVTVSVVDGVRIGSSSVHFTVDSPPTLGEFEIDPPVGTALVDSFKLKCGNGWTSSQQPLLYEYQYKIFNESTWKILSSKSETKSISVSLPAGQLVVRAVVYDSLGTYTETTKKIDVSLPDNNAALIALQNNAKESTSTSSVSSALSVISQMTSTQQRDAPYQLSQLQQITSDFINKYFDQRTAQQILSSVTTDNIISMLSIISSAGDAINVMDSETISNVIGNFSNTLSSVVKSSTIDLSSNEISFSHSTAITFQTYLYQQLSTKTRRLILQLRSTLDEKSLSTLDFTNINEILIDLLYCQLKKNAPDMPAIRGPSIDSFLYARVVTLPTLSGLSEIVDINSYFNISQSINSLPVFDGVQNVKILMTVSIPKNRKILVSSKLVEFIILDSNNNQLEITSSSYVANITVESISLTRSVITDLGCFEYNGEYVLSESCNIVDNQINSYTIQVQKTGTFIIAQHTNQKVEESTITNPNLTTQSNQVGVYVGVAFGVLGCVILFVIVVIVMSNLVRIVRKKREQRKDKDIELQEENINTA